MPVAQPSLPASAMQPAAVGGLGEDAGFAVAGEARDRVAEEGADVDIGGVGADYDHVGAEQGATGAAAGDRQGRDAAGGFRRQLPQRPAFLVAGEGGDRVAVARGRVDGAAVGTDRDRVGAVEADRPGAAFGAFGGDAAGLAFRLEQLAGLLVAAEDRDRVALGGGDVDVLAVGADDDRPRAHERARAGQGPRRTAAGARLGAVDQAAALAGQLDQRSAPRLLLGLVLGHRRGDRGGRQGEDEKSQSNDQRPKDRLQGSSLASHRGEQTDRGQGGVDWVAIGDSTSAGGDGYRFLTALIPCRA